MYWRARILPWVALLAIAGAASAARADSADAGAWYQRCWSGIKGAWCSDQWDVYAPFYAWHNRWVYGSDVRRYNYNENAWGAGFGKSCVNARGNRWSLFAMEFQDSFNNIEPQAGLMWQKIWRDEADARRVTLGAAAGFTARRDLWNYTPVPFALPVLGVEWRRLSLECTYIPPLTFLHLNERGNILLLWARWRL